MNFNLMRNCNYEAMSWSRNDWFSWSFWGLRGGGTHPGNVFSAFKRAIDGYLAECRSHVYRERRERPFVTSSFLIGSDKRPGPFLRQLRASVPVVELGPMGNILNPNIKDRSERIEILERFVKIEEEMDAAFDDSKKLASLFITHGYIFAAEYLHERRGIAADKIRDVFKNMLSTASIESIKKLEQRTIETFEWYSPNCHWYDWKTKSAGLIDEVLDLLPKVEAIETPELKKAA